MKLQIKEAMRTHTTLATVGGVGYNLIELLWRGHTHWSMFFVGGVCFEIIGGIHTRLHHRSLPIRCALCAGAVTVVELLSGYILNVWLKLGVWDYSSMRFNIKGQVCLAYSLLWLLLSAAVCPLYTLCYRAVKRQISM